MERGGGLVRVIISVAVRVRRGRAAVEWALMCVQSRGYLSGATEKAPLAHGHRVSVSASEFGAWPREELDVGNVVLDKRIREPVGT